MKNMFQVGDKVRAFGVSGIVNSIDEDDSYPVEVEFENDKHASFTMEGKEVEWHKEPSLVLVERSNKLVKVYQYAYRSIKNTWHISTKYYLDGDFMLDGSIYEFKRLDHTMIEVEE